MTTKSTPKTIDFDGIAADVLLSGKLNIARYGVVYRAGKSVDDVKKAAEKARLPKNGHAKIEIELSYLAGALVGVFKAA